MVRIDLEYSHAYTLTVIAIIAVVAIILVFAACYSSTVMLNGTLYASDAGNAGEGFEYAATWYAELAVEGTTGTISFELVFGQADRMTKFDYNVTNFTMDSDWVAMKIDGNPVELEWVSQETVWGGEYDDYYIASNVGNVPQDELRGNITTDVFQGFASNFYVELRLR